LKNNLKEKSGRNILPARIKKIKKNCYCIGEKLNSEILQVTSTFQPHAEVTRAMEAIEVVPGVITRILRKFDYHKEVLVALAIFGMALKVAMM